METYRHATYRYSTGHGFNVNVNTPQKAADVAAFKMEPLMHNLGRPSFTVALKREADRISMQVEDAFRQMKNLGYDSGAGKRYRKLKARIEVIKHLMTNYPIEYIKAGDLEKIYKLYESGSPGLDAEIKKVVKANKNATGVETYVATTKKVRKGYPLFDQFGRKLSKADLDKFDKEGGKAKNPFSGLGEAGKTKWVSIIAVIIVGAALLKMFSKKKP